MPSKRSPWATSTASGSVAPTPWKIAQEDLSNVPDKALTIRMLDEPIANKVMGNVSGLTGSGTLDIVIPEGIVEIELTLQAPGGSGASGYGSGGTGGQYIRRKINVKPHNTYRITGGTPGSSNTTFSWVSFDGAAGFTTDSGFTTITAVRGANGISAVGAANGVDAANPYEAPEEGWDITGGTGGEGSPAASGVQAGHGGAVGKKQGGSGANPTSTKNAGGGGGASAMAVGGGGGLDPNNGSNGALGSGGGGGNIGGSGGSSYGRVRW